MPTYEDNCWSKFKWSAGLPGSTWVFQHPSWFCLTHTTLIKHSGSSSHYQGLPVSSCDYQQHSTTFRTIQQPPGTFSDYQDLSAPGPSGTFTILQWHSVTFRIFLRLSEPFRNLQVLSATTKIYQHLPGTISHLHHSAMTLITSRVFHPLPGLPASSWDNQQHSTTFRTIQHFSDYQDLPASPWDHQPPSQSFINIQ